MAQAFLSPDGHLVVNTGLLEEDSARGVYRSARVDGKTVDIGPTLDSKFFKISMEIPIIIKQVH